MDDLVPVRFLRNYSLYNRGEIAGFSSDHSKMLVESKIAVLVKADEEPEYPKDPPKKTSSKKKGDN